jgi:hypothetical protein
MKKNVNALFILLFFSTALSAQKSEIEANPKNSFRFNLGVPAMTSGGNFGFYFDTRYLYKFNKRMSIGGMMSFVSSGESRNGVRVGGIENPPKDLITKGSLGTGLVIPKGLVLLDENEYKTEHIGGSFLFNYDFIQKRKRTLGVYIGLGLSHVSIHSLPEAYSFQLVGVPEKSVVYIPNYVRLLDISMPFGINYNYNINERWYIGCDVGVNVYQKYVGFYYHAAFSFGAKF